MFCERNNFNHREKIGASQIAFINSPTLKLNFTGAASVADFSLIDNAICKVILDIIASMAVLPNRYLVKLDVANDYFKTYQHHLGVLRLTVDKVTGLAGRKKTGVMGFLDKISKDVPDCYCKVRVGAEKDVWRTSTKQNELEPVWDETHDFLVMDHDQFVSIDLRDEDIGGDGAVGLGITSIKQLLLSGGTQELSLIHGGETTATGIKLTLRAEYYHFVPDATSLSPSGGNNAAQDRICGLATVLIASVNGLTGHREDLKPSVKVSWGAKEFRTSTMSYSPGVDIFNPGFDTPFKFPITADMISEPAAFKVTLMNKDEEAGKVDIPFIDVLNAPGMVLQDKFAVGSGAVVRACICVSGTQLAK
jgi:hypothetical protein